MKKFAAAALVLGSLGGLSAGGPQRAEAATQERLALSGPILCLELSMPPRVCHRA